VRRYALFLLCSLLIVSLGNGLPSALRAETGPTTTLRAERRSDPAETAGFVPGRLVVKFGPSVAAGGRGARLADLKLTPSAHLALSDLELVNVPEGEELAWAKELAALPGVLYAEPDYYVQALARPNDPLYDLFQWNLPLIGLEEAWEISTGSASVVVAIVDTGVDLSHPDLAPKLVAGYDMVNNDAHPSDDEGHGTHVAGIVGAATNNGIGVAGVSWQSRLMPIKSLGSDGQGTHSMIAEGMRWACRNGARVINLSLGGRTNSTTLSQAVGDVYRAGCLLVAAAGNEYASGSPAMYPAALDRVLAVGATDYKDGRASYSNVGNYVAVVAPGGDPWSDVDPEPLHWIRSTYWRDAGPSYHTYKGTSQACAHVSGVAALVWAVNPSLTSDQVAQVIVDTARDLGVRGWDPEYGHGRVDAAAAVLAASSMASPTVTPSPSATPTPTRTPTLTPTRTFTPTTTPTRTSSPSPTPSGTGSPSGVGWRLPLVLRHAVWVPTPTPTWDPYPPPPTPTPTETPWPYPWPTTGWPTATRGATATPSPAATPTATQTLTPVLRCSEVIRNGGFETTAEWTRSGARPARYTSKVFRSGARAMRFGITPGEPLVFSHSAAYQRVSIPAAALSATLTFWWQRGTEEAVLSSMIGDDFCPEGLALASLTYTRDCQEVLLLDGASYRLVANGVLTRALANDAAWVRESFDLTPWRGRSLVLYLNAFNTGYGGRTWMYVDDVSLEVCQP